MLNITAHGHIDSVNTAVSECTFELVFNLSSLVKTTLTPTSVSLVLFTIFHHLQAKLLDGLNIALALTDHTVVLLVCYIRTLNG
jgi:hypothetical protein